MALQPFLWNDNRAMTPQQVERERARAAAQTAAGVDFSPVGHWTQGAARLVSALGGNLREGRAQRAEDAGISGAADRVSGILGGGGQGYSSPVAMALADGGMNAPAPQQDPLMSMGQEPGSLVPNEMAPGGLAMGVNAQMNLPDGIAATAAALGMDPVDLATIISYETAGTFDPTKRGPTTQWGQHRGLIQFGEPQAQEYGVNWDDPLNSQLGPDGAVARYFRQNGWQPGMGLLDAYSIVNAGGPGLYNRSDANNGGAPGTVADKVNNQMGGHRQNALALLGGDPGEYLGAGGGYSPVVSAMASGPSSTDLMSLMADPWVMQEYGPVLQALAGQAGQREQAIFAQQLAQADPMYQAQLAQLTAPAPVDPWAGVQEFGGVPYRMGANGAEIVPGFNAPSPTAQSGIAKLQADLAAGLISPEQYAIGEQNIAQGSGTTVNVGDQGQRMGQVPSGFAAVEDPTNASGFRLEPIPGGPAAMAANDAARGQESAVVQADQIISAIDGILNDEALDKATGMLSFTQGIPGTDAYRFGTRARQLEGQAFLQAFESLKGGGAITEIEGQKATAAIGRLDTAQSAADYRSALNDLREVILAARARAGGAAPAAAPTGGALINGYSIRPVN